MIDDDHRISIEWTSLCKKIYTVKSLLKSFTCWLEMFAAVFAQASKLKIKLSSQFLYFVINVSKQEYSNINPDKKLFHKLLHELKLDFLICLFWK